MCSPFPNKYRREPFMCLHDEELVNAMLNALEAKAKSYGYVLYYTGAEFAPGWDITTELTPTPKKGLIHGSLAPGYQGFLQGGGCNVAQLLPASCRDKVYQ